MPVLSTIGGASTFGFRSRKKSSAGFYSSFDVSIPNRDQSNLVVFPYTSGGNWGSQYGNMLGYNSYYMRNSRFSTNYGSQAIAYVGEVANPNNYGQATIFAYRWSNGFGSKYTGPFSGFDYDYYNTGNTLGFNSDYLNGIVTFSPLNDAILFSVSNATNIANYKSWVYGWQWSYNSGFGAQIVAGGIGASNSAIGDLEFSPTGGAIFLGTYSNYYHSPFTDLVWQGQVNAFQWSNGVGSQYSAYSVHTNLPDATGNSRSYYCNNVLATKSGFVGWVCADYPNPLTSDYTTSVFYFYRWSDSAGFGTEYSQPVSTMYVLSQNTNMDIYPDGSLVVVNGASVYGTTPSRPYIYNFSQTTGFGTIQSIPTISTINSNYAYSYFGKDGKSIFFYYPQSPDSYWTEYAFDKTSGIGTMYSLPGQFVMDGATSPRWPVVTSMRFSR
jgi:hypothetical protein